MIEAVLKIVREFLEEQYPDNKFNCEIKDKPYFHTDKTMTEYSFRIGPADPYTWIIIMDNRSGANNLFKNEIYYRTNNIKNLEMLTNQLELLGLNKLY